MQFYNPLPEKIIKLVKLQNKKTKLFFILLVNPYILRTSISFPYKKSILVRSTFESMVQ